MIEVMDYICRRLQVSESKLNAVAKAFRKQNKINKSVSLFMAASTIEMIMLVMEQNAQAERIGKLEKEIEELKRTEGE